MRDDSRYRPNAGIMVLNKEGKVLLCQRSDINGNWQMPQGGIDEGEDTKIAAIRELEEETAIVAKDVEILDFLDEYQYYDFPEKVRAAFIAKYNDDYFIGQKQKWLVVRYLKDDNTIDISKAKDNEFSDYQWAFIDDAIEMVWEAKQNTYRRLKEEFKDLLKVK